MLPLQKKASLSCLIITSKEGLWKGGLQHSSINWRTNAGEEAKRIKNNKQLLTWYWKSKVFFSDCVSQLKRRHSIKANWRLLSKKLPKDNSIRIAVTLRRACFTFAINVPNLKSYHLILQVNTKVTLQCCFFLINPLGLHFVQNR